VGAGKEGALQEGRLIEEASYRACRGRRFVGRGNDLPPVERWGALDARNGMRMLRF
jgi:hypothetical protein